MPHRFCISIAEAARFDSRLARHALSRLPKEKMQREAATADQDPQSVARPSDSRVSELSSSFQRTLITSSAPRPPLSSWIPFEAAGGMPAFWGPFQRQPPLLTFPPYYIPHLIHGRGFHTTSCYSPQFPNARRAVMQSRDAAAGVKRTWEDDRRASYSGERNRSRHMVATEHKRHHRSESCGELEKSSRRRPKLTEEDVRAEVRRLRRWEYTNFGRDHRIRPKAGMEFTIMTYNVLAQCLLEDNKYLYEHCERGVLLWDYRKMRILKELAEANADVICLQEIQCEHYQDFFVPELRNLGYTGRYKKRTGDKNDGCAIFFKSDTFTLDSCTSVEYTRPGLSLLDRDNIALVAMLRPKHGRGGKVCVANTHLLFNPGRGDIKLAQLQILLAEIDRFAYHRLAQSYHPVILCGDMNSEPNCSIYEFVSTGALHYEGLVAGDISGQAEGCRKGRFALAKELIPEQFGISDQCQYVDTISERLSSGKGRAKTDEDGDVGRPEIERDGRAGEDEIIFGRQPETLPVMRSSQISDKNRKSDDRPRSSGLQPEGSEKATSDKDERSASTSSSSSSSQSEAASADIRSKFSTGKMSHGLNFVSAYDSNINRARGKPAAVTTHHRKGSCMVDYIFYTVRSKNSRVKQMDAGRRVEHRDTKDGSLSLIATYGLLTCEELTRLGGLPNSVLPSDHLAIVAKFLLRDDS